MTIKRQCKALHQGETVTKEGLPVRITLSASRDLYDTPPNYERSNKPPPVLSGTTTTPSTLDLFCITLLSVHDSPSPPTATMNVDRSQIPMLQPAPTQLEVVPGYAVGHQVTLILKESFVSHPPALGEFSTDGAQDNFSIRDLDNQPVISVKSRFGFARKKGVLASRCCSVATSTEVALPVPLTLLIPDFVDNYGNTVFSLKGKKYTFQGLDSGGREVLTVSSPVVTGEWEGRCGEAQKRLADHTVYCGWIGFQLTHTAEPLPPRRRSMLTAADTKLDATFVNTFTHTPETVTIQGRWPGDIVEIFWHGHLIALIMRRLTKRDILGQNTVSGEELLASGSKRACAFSAIMSAAEADHSTL
jgi:hypothetical protein